MKNLISENPAPNKKLELTAPAAVVSGEFLLIGSFPVVAPADVANGEKGTFLAEQTISHAKAGAAAFTEGAIVYWDAGAKLMTDDADGGANKKVGHYVGLSGTDIVVKMLPEAV